MSCYRQIGKGSLSSSVKWALKGVVFALMGYLAISGNIFGNQNWESATGI